MSSENKLVHVLHRSEDLDVWSLVQQLVHFHDARSHCQSLLGHELGQSGVDPVHNHDQRCTVEVGVLGPHALAGWQFGALVLPPEFGLEQFDLGVFNRLHQNPNGSSLRILIARIGIVVDAEHAGHFEDGIGVLQHFLHLGVDEVIGALIDCVDDPGVREGDSLEFDGSEEPQFTEEHHH